MRSFPMTVVAFILCWFPAVAAAHVYITAPETNAVVPRGSEVEVTWEIAVNHGPPDTYDLMFSRDGGSQFESIAADLPSSRDSVTWTAPTADVPEAVLAIVQHGSNGYEFMHEVAFSIGGSTVEPPDAGLMDAGTSSDVGVADGGQMPELFDRPDAGMPVPADEATPSTGEDVLALMEDRCAIAGCHSPDTAQAGLILTPEAFPDNLRETPSTLSDGALLLDVEEPGSSELLARLRGESGLRMPPPPEEEFSDEQIAAFEQWIAAGAPETGGFEQPVAGADAGSSDRDSADDGGGGCTTTGGVSPPVWMILVCLLAGRRRRS